MPEIKETNKNLYDDMKVKRKKRGMTSIDEIVDMKVLKMQGLSNRKIAEIKKRGIQTVSKALKKADELIEYDDDIAIDIFDRLEEIRKKQLENAEKIINMADEQVMLKIGAEETKAKDAAQIRQIYGNIMQNAVGVGGESDELEKSSKVVNFINTVINIQNDRSKKRTTITKATGGNEQGRAKDGVEGVVS